MGLDKKIGEILVSEGFCKEEDIDKALSLQKEYGGRIGTILINTGVIVENHLLKALSLQLGLPLLKDLSIEEFNKVPLNSVSNSFLKENEIFIFDEEGDSLKAAVEDPLKVDLFSCIEMLSSKKLELYLANAQEMRKLKTLYEEDEEGDYEYINEDEIDKLKELASEAPVIKFVNNIFSKAVESRASDIHVESYKNGMQVRFRIDGKLHTVESVPLSMKMAVIARLKLISKMNISENRLPQDGRISIKTTGKLIDIRASSVPTAFGESFVLRLLGKQDISYSLSKLGFFENSLEIISDIVKKPNGIFLTTGPTGSGKTTTLYSILNDLNTDDTKIITVEDPVEYELNGISQIQVKSEIDFTFANALRSILRQDPDIIMIGEIRDKETAEIAVQAALTGHLVLSTLHTNSALGSLHRLIDMGVEYFLLKSSIIGIMAQRLVRTLCPHCKQKDEISEDARLLYGIDRVIQKHPFIKVNPHKPVGCSKCNNTGFLGRLPIVEVAPFSKEIQDAFAKDNNLEDLSRFGYTTLFEDGILKYLNGDTTLDEVLRVAK